MQSELDKHVNTLTCSLLAIRDIFADPSTLNLDDVATSMGQLEAALHAKSLIDASFDFICERDRAGRLVGAKHADAYLKERLGLSPREARERIARGRDLFAEPVLPDPPEEPKNSPNEETPEDAAFRRAREKAAQDEERRRAKEEQERARGNRPTRPMLKNRPQFVPSSIDLLTQPRGHGLASLLPH